MNDVSAFRLHDAVRCQLRLLRIERHRRAIGIQRRHLRPEDWVMHSHVSDIDTIERKQGLQMGREFITGATLQWRERGMLAQLAMP